MLHTARGQEAGFQGCNSSFAADSVSDHRIITPFPFPHSAKDEPYSAISKDTERQVQLGLTYPEFRYDGLVMPKFQ